MSKFPALQLLLRAIDACVAEQPDATDLDIRLYCQGGDLEVMRRVHGEMQGLFAVLGWSWPKP
jgi:hypothetical protein